MGVGRNLAYKKDLFFEVNGFASHMKLRSGDDDLFVNQNGNKKTLPLYSIRIASQHQYQKLNLKIGYIKKKACNNL